MLAVRSVPAGSVAKAERNISRCETGGAYYHGDTPTTLRRELLRILANISPLSHNEGDVGFFVLFDAQC